MYIESTDSSHALAAQRTSVSLSDAIALPRPQLQRLLRAASPGDHRAGQVPTLNRTGIPLQLAVELGAAPHLRVLAEPSLRDQRCEMRRWKLPALRSTAAYVGDPTLRSRAEQEAAVLLPSDPNLRARHHSWIYVGNGLSERGPTPPTVYFDGAWCESRTYARRTLALLRKHGCERAPLQLATLHDQLSDLARPLGTGVELAPEGTSRIKIYWRTRVRSLDQVITALQSSSNLQFCPKTSRRFVFHFLSEQSRDHEAVVFYIVVRPRSDRAVDIKFDLRCRSSGSSDREISRCLLQFAEEQRIDATNYARLIHNINATHSFVGIGFKHGKPRINAYLNPMFGL